MKKKHSELLMYGLIGIIALLFAVMLWICGLYLDLRINGISSSLPDIPEKDKWILTGRGYDSHSNTGSLVMPVFVGVKTPDTGMLAATYDNESRELVWNEMKEYVKNVFSGIAKRLEFSDESQKAEFVKSVCTSERFYYAAFYGEIPSVAVYTDIAGNAEDSGADSLFSVKYIFVLPDENGNACGICFDGDLDAYKLLPEESMSYVEKNSLAYNGMGGIAEFEFVSDTYPEAVFTSSFEVDSAMLAESLPFFDFDPESEETKQLLKAFGFNTNLVRTFDSGDGDTINFIDDGRTFAVYESENTIVYSGDETGIHLSEYLRYQPGDSGYTFTDELLCVKYFLNSVERLLLGGEAVPYLVSTRRSSLGTVFSFKYFYNGIMITEEQSDVTVTVKDGYITGVRLKALFCDSGTLKKTVMPQKLAVSVFEQETGGFWYNAMYVKKSESYDTELVWVQRREGED